MPKCDLALPGPSDVLQGPGWWAPPRFWIPGAVLQFAQSGGDHATPASHSGLLSAGPGSVCMHLGASKAGFEIQGDPGESGQFAAPVVW